MKLPENFEWDGKFVMSNSDREINYDIAENIKGKPLYSHYAAYDFCGSVWWQDDMWHCDIERYRSYIKTYSANTLDEIMDDARSDFGCE